MRLRILVLALAVTAFAGVSCYDTSGLLVLDGIGDHQVSQHPIINGFPPDSPEHDATVALHQLTKRGQVYVSPFCSGTLITEDVVLTAAHCLNTATAATSAR